MLTNAQLIKELRKPGKVMVPVIMAEDVAHVVVQKDDLILYLQGFHEQDAAAPWCFCRMEGNARVLDVQN